MKKDEKFLKPRNILSLDEKRCTAIMTYATEAFCAAILLTTFIYNAAGIFFSHDGLSNPVDVVFRTVSAAAFGYFIGRSGVNSERDAAFCPLFATVAVIITSVASAIVLFVVRYAVEITAYNTAAVSQLRDFVSMGMGTVVLGKMRHP